MFVVVEQHPRRQSNRFHIYFRKISIVRGSLGEIAPASDAICTEGAVRSGRHDVDKFLVVAPPRAKAFRNAFFLLIAMVRRLLAMTSSQVLTTVWGHCMYCSIVGTLGLVEEAPVPRRFSTSPIILAHPPGSPDHNDQQLFGNLSEHCV